MTYKSTVDYIDTKIMVESDNFPELLEAIGGISELSRDFHYLKKRLNGDFLPVPFYRLTKEGYQYYGVKDVLTGKNVVLGQFNEKGRVIPFFPKGDEGYDDPANREAA